MDCFRRRSSSYGGQVVAALLAMTSVSIPAARFRPGFASFAPLDESEGAGNAGRQTHPQPCVQLKKHASKSPQVRRTIRHSLRDSLRLMPRSPRCTGLCSHRRSSIILASLIPASGDQDHTALSSAFALLVRQRICVHRIPHHVS
jgi:hypothetical protein